MTDLFDMAVAAKLAGGGGGSAPVLHELGVRANGTYNASDDNCDGFSKVTVNVPADTKAITVVQNGVYNAALEGKDGYSQVTVAVPSEPMKLCIINSSYDWSDYRSIETAVLIRNEIKPGGYRETLRAAACGAFYIPAGKTAVIYSDIDGMEVGGWRTTEVGYPYNSEWNWGRGWVSTPAMIDNSNSAVPYIFVPHFRYSDDRTLTDDNRPQFCFAEIR